MFARRKCVFWEKVTFFGCVLCDSPLEVQVFGSPGDIPSLSRLVACLFSSRSYQGQETKMIGLRILLLELIISLVLFVDNTTAFFWWNKKTIPTDEKETKVPEAIGVQWEQCDGNSDADECSQRIIRIFDNGSSDMKDSRTVTLTNKLCSLITARADITLAAYICNKVQGPIGCTLHDRQGNRVDSCDDIHRDDGDDEMMVWMVPKNRLFMWPTFEIGNKAIVRDVVSPVAGEKIILETISREPKIFRVFNFFSEEESEEMIQNAMAATEEEYRLKR